MNFRALLSKSTLAERSGKVLKGLKISQNLKVQLWKKNKAERFQPD